MLLDMLLVVVLAPCAAILASWMLWTVVVSGDWVMMKVRSRLYRRRLDRLPVPSTMSELQLSERLYEIDWLRRHAAEHPYWNHARLHERFRALYEQLELQQISREAHQLWQRQQEQRLVSKYKNLF